MKKVFLISVLLYISAYSQHIEEFRAVKITDIDSPVMYSDGAIAEAMNYLASINVNVILPVVWNGGYTQYPSAIMDSLFGKPIDPAFAGRDPLQRLIIEAHRVGIEVYPWFEYGFAAWYSGGTPPYGGHILQKFPEWALRTSDGKVCVKNGFDWMAATNPEVQDFIRDLTLEVISNYDVDGVEYSDRIPALPVEGGYDSVTVALYKAEHNGAEPPANFRDPAWMRWRADKLNAWYAEVRDSVKARDSKLFVSSSPSLYPWSYQEYLQDGKTWMEQDIADHFIPQLYRYNFSDYLYELNNAVNLAGEENRDKLFAGILMNIGTGSNAYVMSPEYLLQSLEANRNRGVKGEALFFYEGLRKNDNLLGDTLKATYYSEYALVPGRDNVVRRPPAQIVNETEAELTGSWEDYMMLGYDGLIKRTDNTSYASAEYSFNVIDAAWYDVYVYFTPNIPWTDNASYTVYTGGDSIKISAAQNDLKKKGWHKIATVNLDKGAQRVVKLDNSQLEDGKYLTADAVMILINRKLSPDAMFPVSVEEEKNSGGIPAAFGLSQNYPNPFNPATKIEFTIPADNGGAFTELTVFDVLGRKVTQLVNGYKKTGSYSVNFNAEGLASGVYIYRLTSGSYSVSKKMILLR